MAHYVESPATFLAAEALVAFRRVKFTSAARTVEYADEADEAIGITEASAASGDPVSVRLYSHAGTFKVVCAAASCSVGDSLYPAADGKLSTTKLSSNERFLALVAGTAAGDVLEVAKVDQGGAVLAYSQVAAGSALTASSPATAISTKTLSGENLKAGDVLLIEAQGIATATNSTDTLTVKLYVGTEEIVTTGAVDVANSDIYRISAQVVVRTAGASATVVASGTVGLGASGTVTAKNFYKASAVEDLSGDVAISVKGTWSTTDAGNSCRSDVFNVVVLKA